MKKVFLGAIVSMVMVIGFAMTASACDDYGDCSHVYYCNHIHTDDCILYGCDYVKSNSYVEQFFTLEVFGIKQEYIANNNLAGFWARVEAGELSVFDSFEAMVYSTIANSYPLTRNSRSSCLFGPRNKVFVSSSSGSGSHWVPFLFGLPSLCNYTWHERVYLVECATCGTPIGVLTSHSSFHICGQ
ncbi:MAG: hypothetical protein FWE44_06480 [Defluviitaleaceae bacterium]|nr:hypothetical protein [Defluviitaleaceae bacterium]